MTWAILLFFHLVGLVGYTLILRKSASSAINKYFLAASLQTAIFLPSIFFFTTGQIDFSLEMGQWIRLITSGILIVGLHLTAIKALSLLDASLFSIIYNLRLFFVTVLGFFFLDELPPILQIIGGGVIFSSILLLNLQNNKRYRSSPILWGLLATAWLSVHVTLEKYNIIDVGFATYMFIAMLIGTVLLWLLVLSRNVKIKDCTPYVDKMFVWLLVLRPLSAWSITYALLYGSLAATSYVSGLSVVLVVVFGIFLLKEKENVPQKIAATAVGIFGLTLILVSKL